MIILDSVGGVIASIHSSDGAAIFGAFRCRWLCLSLLGESWTLDESRKRVIAIMASILAARKLAQFDSGARVPVTINAIADAVRWAEQIMAEIDRRWRDR